jgi:putative ABC transport system substrate-binding protein
MTFCIRRREFIAGLGGAAAWPLATRAQQRALPVVGFLHLGDPAADADVAAAFRNGLREAGYIEGQDVTIEYRWARNDNSRLVGFIDDLVHRHCGKRRGNADAIGTSALFSGSC